MAKTILQALKAKLEASGATVAEGLDGKGLTISEAIDALEFEGGTTPTGSVTVTLNGEQTDVAQYAKAIVAVPTVLISYDANGGTGSIVPSPGTVMGKIYYKGGSSLTPPAGKKFKCWRVGGTSEEGHGDAYPGEGEFYQVARDTTFYAIWEDA